MTWGLAKSAARRVLSAFLPPALRPPVDGKAPHGPALIIAPKSKANGARISPDLTLRAYRLHNRNPMAAERYLRLHLTLSKGVCSNE